MDYDDLYSPENFPAWWEELLALSGAPVPPEVEEMLPADPQEQEAEDGDPLLAGDLSHTQPA